MKTRPIAFLVLAILALASLACSIQIQLTPTPVYIPVVTLLVQTVVVPATNPPPILTSTCEAAGCATPKAAATNTPVVTSTPITPTATATNTATNTPSGPTVTPTPPPTVTPNPATYTPTGGVTRTGVRVSVPYFSGGPSIDGNWSDWGSGEYPANHVVYGGGNWTGSGDLSSSFKIGWDNANLYLAVKVNDDQYVQNATGYNIYKGDSLEILLDTNVSGDYYSTTLSSDDYQLAISPGLGSTSGGKEAYLYYPKSLTGGRSVTVASSGGSGTYYVEAAIPWGIFGITPESGKHYGFAFSVSDNDNPGENEQDTMVSNVSTRRLTNPTTWGDLVLN